MRASGVLELEEAAAAGWPALESAWLGRWLLRASEGFTGRGNSVLPLGDPGRPLPDALDRVSGWYAERGLPPRFQLPLPAAGALADELADRGWTSYHPTSVLVADRAALTAALPSPAGVTLAGAPDRDWLAGYHYRGGPLPEVGVRLLTGARQQAFAAVREAGRVVAIGRVACADGWAGITAMEVDPAHRRRGLAARVLAGLVGWSADRGADGVYLQVAAENEGARALYDRYGFTHHHDYRYARPAGTA